MSEKRIKFGNIKINDISKQHILDCLDASHITMGPKTELFEEKWAAIFGYPHTVAFNSGTSALIAALITLYDFDAKPGDGIICPALSFIATGNAIRAAGFFPIFVDIRKEDLQINEQEVESAINNCTSRHIAGIVAVNLMGFPCRLDILKDIATRHNLKLIVDNCEAYGSKLNNKYSLHYADMEITSHYIAHIIQSAEMGTVSTKEHRIKDILKSIRNHGRRHDTLYFEHLRYGLNLKPTDLHASIGLGQIDNFWDIFNKRKEILRRYYDTTQEFDDKFYLLTEKDNIISAPHAFSMTVQPISNPFDNIDIIKRKLDNANIEWKRNFENMPTSYAFNYLQLYPDFTNYSNSIYASRFGIHIGCSDLMSNNDIDYVCDTLKNIFKGMK